MYYIVQMRGGFVEHPSLTYLAEQSVTKIISVQIINLVTPKAGAKHELSVNIPPSGAFQTETVFFLLLQNSLS